MPYLLIPVKTDCQSIETNQEQVVQKFQTECVITEQQITLKVLHVGQLFSQSTAILRIFHSLMPWYAYTSFYRKEMKLHYKILGFLLALLNNKNETLNSYKYPVV